MNSTDTDSLLAAARRAQARAYAPYSGLAVGAAIRTRSGTLYAGCNVENAAYPVGTCAEAAAVAAMILGGENEIAEVLIVSTGEAAPTPCGACRQILSEFAGAGTQVHAANRAGVQASFALADLLPHSFGPANLPAPEARTKK
jgi:cytidine deaminase